MTIDRLPQPKNIIVFGASGKTGRLVVEEALAKKHRVKAFVRDRASAALSDRARLPIARENFSIFAGNVMDLQAVEQAIKESDAVISVLGWAKDSPKDLLATSGKIIIETMEKLGISRLITVIGAAVDAPNDNFSSMSRRLIVSLIKKIEPELFADSQKLADTIYKSNLDWTVVRVPRLVNGDRTETYRYGQLDLGFGAKVRRSDLAYFLVQQIDSNEFMKQAPTIAS